MLDFSTSLHSKILTFCFKFSKKFLELVHNHCSISRCKEGAFKVMCVSCSVVSYSFQPLEYCLQGSISMGFSRQKYWSGQPFPSPGDLPNPGIKPRFPSLQADSSPSEPPGKPCLIYNMSLIKLLMPSPKPALSVVFFRNCHLCPLSFSSKKSWCYLLLSHTPHMIHYIHHELLILGKTRKEGNLGSQDEKIEVKY